MPPLRSLASLELTTVSLGVQGLGSAFTYIGSLVFMMRAALGAGLPDKEQTRAMVSGLWVISDCAGGYLGSQLGSLAYDTIMVFEDQFKNHIRPDKVHILNVCFIAPHMRREFGGCAGKFVEYPADTVKVKMQASRAGEDISKLGW